MEEKIREAEAVPAGKNYIYHAEQRFTIRGQVLTKWPISSIGKR